MVELTASEKMYVVIKKIPQKSLINLTDVSNQAQCSLAYVSHTLKMAKVCGFVKMDREGNLFRSTLPTKTVWVEKIREEDREYRKRVKGTGTRRTGKAIPKEFVINEENVSAVITEMFNRNKVLQVRFDTVVKYAKQLKEKNQKLRKELKERE